MVGFDTPHGLAETKSYTGSKFEILKNQNTHTNIDLKLRNRSTARESYKIILKFNFLTNLPDSMKKMKEKYEKNYFPYIILSINMK